MLAAIGVGSVQEIFDRQIPAPVRLGRSLQLPDGLPEQDVFEHLRALASRNTSAEDELSFLGAGMYDHYVPALIDMLTERSEFLTPYTPYQPEISQGDAAGDVRVSDGDRRAHRPRGLERVGLRGALRRRGGRRIWPSCTTAAAASSSAQACTRTRSRRFAPTPTATAVEVVEVPLRDGVTDPDAWAQAIDARHERGDLRAAELLRRRRGRRRAERVREDGGRGELGADGAGFGLPSDPVVICQVDPITLGVLAPPGDCGVDVAVGEGQPLGNRLDFGGPSFGLFAAREEYLRRMPGRIAGETVDVDGRRGFVLTLQTREQHIRREKATSNICTAQALNALAGVVYLAWLGRRGIVELGELLLARTHYAREQLGALGGVEKLHEQPVIREFALRLDADVAAVRRRCAGRGVNPGVDVHALSGREEDRGVLLVAITERRTRADIDRLVEVLGAAVASERRETVAV